MITRSIIAVATPIAMVAILLFTILVITNTSSFAGNEMAVSRKIAGAAGLVGLFLLLGINYNRISPHYFYRDRLVETYLTTEGNKNADNELKVIRDDENILLTEINVDNSPAPYHLIQCALNLPGSRNLARRDRKSDHFIFSRHYCGSNTTGHIETENYHKGKITLARAMTISGAAVGSLMGYHSSLATTFITTIFNLRLGYWMLNPIHIKTSTPDNPSEVTSQPESFSPSREPYTFWPRYLCNELLGRASAREKFINISDGGHTGDNLGIYPLLQRRCELILVGDGEADPDYTFGSLAAGIRQIFTDENVRVDIDPRPVQISENSPLPAEHFLIGKITYPEETQGWLIVIKSSFTNKDETIPTRSYAAKNKQFPHQTTADQFFDDDQFEAYRSLGYTAVSTLLASLPKMKEAADQENPTQSLISSCEDWWKEKQNTNNIEYNG